jgi:riboflavin biosynthesis pyrimidine reductase
VRGIDDDDGFLHPRQLRAALADEGVRRVLVEGGGVTVSRFIEAGCMDRLHLVVSPVLLGEGRRALHLPGVPSLDVAQRPNCRTESLGPDTLFDIDLSECTAAERAPPGTSA